MSTLKAFYPTFQSADGTLVRFGVGVRCRAEQVHIGKLVVRSVQRIESVKQGLELTAHFVVVNRGCKCHHVGLLNELDNGASVVIQHALAGILTGQAAYAKVDFLSAKGHHRHFIACCFCALDKLT